MGGANSIFRITIFDGLAEQAGPITMGNDSLFCFAEAIL